MMNSKIEFILKAQFMKHRNLGIFVILSLLTACASIPKETVTLSQTLGNDLVILHHAHRNIITIHFDQIKDDVNSFVDEVYTPFIIHYVLKSEFQKFKAGNPSLYGAIEDAGNSEDLKVTKNAISVMQEFQEAARFQIEKRRNELMTQILKQESDITAAIDQSYEDAIYANSTITGYLQSIRKVKAAQQEALSMIGLSGADTLITNSLVQISDRVSKAVQLGKKIDVMSDDAKTQLDEISNQIKEITKIK